MIFLYKNTNPFTQYLRGLLALTSDYLCFEPPPGSGEFLTKLLRSTRLSELRLAGIGQYIAFHTVEQLNTLVDTFKAYLDELNCRKYITKFNPGTSYAIFSLY